MSAPISVSENRHSLSSEDQAAIDTFFDLVARVARRQQQELLATLTPDRNSVYSRVPGMTPAPEV